MKNLFFGIGLLLLAGCAKNKEQAASEPVNEDTNQALYNQVMDVHDEVMPQMDNIMKLKRELQEKISAGASLPEEQRQALEQKIQQLDSAGRSMMDWMAEFKPEDYQGEELREYLESEMERVKKVRESMLEAIDQAGKN
jgi:hypothetical protein